MSEPLTVTKERVLEAAELCPTAKEVLFKMFPEAFVDPDWKDITDDLVFEMRSWVPVIYNKKTDKIEFNIDIQCRSLGFIAATPSDTKFENGRIWRKK